MKVLGRTESGMIRVMFDGDEDESFIPDDPGNRHRKMIAEWEAAGNMIPPFEPLSPTIEDVAQERDRRLSVGFDYDFGDVRGIHRVATSEGDMRKWMDEVNPISQTFINVGQPDAEITVATETGTVIITAAEWQQILLAAFQYRQPLYLASFALQAMDPIPANYADDSYWPPA